jgi:anti-sigma factor (TIGR02949 family)
MPSFDPSDCHAVFARLSDWADRELSADDLQAIDVHLETCRMCGDEFRFEMQTLDAIKRAVRAAQAPQGLRERVFAHLHEAQG